MTSPSSEASLRQLARLIGVSEKAVRKARTAGVFSAEAVGIDANGGPVVLDLSLAVRDWEKSGRRLRAERRPAARPTVSPAPPPPAIASTDLLEPLEPLEPVGAGEAGGGPQSISLVDAQTATMLERARKLRMENDLQEGRLVEVHKAAKVGFEFSRTVRENILNLPARLAAELAAESDAARVYTRLDSALREALEATATALEAAVNE